MKTRMITLASGRRMRVPENIQRLESPRLAGWQVRYHGTKYFADGPGSPRDSLRRATAELTARIKKHPAPAKLHHAANATKLNGMPLGISGPVVRRRHNFLEASLHVSLPRFGQVPRRKTIYLGTESTYTVQRVEAALARALVLRSAAEAAYRRAVTAARRAAA